MPTSAPDRQDVGDPRRLAMDEPAAATPRRLALLFEAERRRWPRLTVGRRVLGPGEVAWRQAVTLATADELAALAAALARGPVPTSAPEEVR